MKQLITLLSAIQLFSSTLVYSYPLDQAIYGADNRKEIDQVTKSKIIEQTNAVALMVSNSRLNNFDENNYSYFAVNLGAAANLCPNARFATQPVLGTCSGFLVAPDTLVTAGHCVTNPSDCSNNSWVFNFTSTNSGQIKKSKVFKCQSIVKTTQITNHQTLEDYAIIKLDRKVEGVKPLKFRTRGKLRSRSKVYVIGHPDGIPMKYSDNARVRPFVRFNFSFDKDFGIEKHDYYEHRKDVFLTNLDTFAGNSGSPVFNQRTGIVEGILIEGETDYQFDMNNGCNQVYRIKNNSFDEVEVVQRITKLPKNLLK